MHIIIRWWCHPLVVFLWSAPCGCPAWQHLTPWVAGSLLATARGRAHSAQLSLHTMASVQTGEFADCMMEHACVHGLFSVEGTSYGQCTAVAPQGCPSDVLWCRTGAVSCATGDCFANGSLECRTMPVHHSLVCVCEVCTEPVPASNQTSLQWQCALPCPRYNQQAAVSCMHVT